MNVAFIMILVGLHALSTTAKFCGYANDLSSCEDQDDFYPNTTCANNRNGNYAFPTVFSPDFPRQKTLIHGKALLGWTNCAEFQPDAAAQSKRSALDLIDSRVVDVTQDAYAITVKVTPSSNCTLMLSNSKNTITGSSPLIIKSPSDFTTKTQSAKATAICSESIYEQDVMLEGVWNCPVSDCIACWKAWNHFRCQSKAVKTLLIVLLLLLISLVPLSVLLSCWIAKCIYARWTVKTKNKIVNNMLAAHEATSEGSDGLVRRKPTDTEMVSLNLTILIAVACICISPASAVTCSTVPTGASPISACHQQGQYMNCSTIISTTSTLLGLDSGVCLTTTDNFNKSHSLQIGLTSFKRTVSLSKQYYTGSYSIVSSSHKRCASKGACPSSGGCAGISSPSTSCTELSGAICTLPGLTRCQDSCGCAGCGCGLCSSGCLYYRVAAQPSGTPYSVSTPSGVTTTAVLNVCWDGACTTNTVTIGTSVKIGNTTILVNGLTASSSTIFGTRSVIRSASGTTWVQAASNPQGPVLSSIGDYQTDTAANFLAPTATNAIFPFTSLSVSFGQSSVSVGQPTNGIATLLTSNQLPAQIYDATWSSPTESTLVGAVTSIPTVSLQLTGTANFVALIKSACPVIVKANFTGCFRCDVGATLTLDMTNGCELGPVTITATSVTLLNPVQSLATGSSKMIVQLQSDVRSADSTIKVCGETLCSTILASFTLNEIVSIVPTGSDSNAPDDTIKGGGGLSLSWLDSLATWAKGLLWSGVSIAVIVVIVLLVYFGLKLWRKRQENKVLFQPLLSERQNTHKASSVNSEYNTMEDEPLDTLPEPVPKGPAIGLAHLSSVPKDALFGDNGDPLYIVEHQGSYGLTQSNPFHEAPIGALGYATEATRGLYPNVTLGSSGYE